MEKYTVVKVFLDECNAHPEWNKSEISQTLLDEIENLIDNATRFEKALDKACTELLEWVKSCSANNTGEMNGVYPFNTKEQWKEWCME